MKIYQYDADHDVDSDETAIAGANCRIRLAPVVLLTRKAPNTTICEFANLLDPDETAHNEPSHLDLQCLPSSL